MIMTFLRFWVCLIGLFGLLTACTPVTGEGQGTRNGTSLTARGHYSGLGEGRSSLLGGKIGQYSDNFLNAAEPSSAYVGSGDFWTHLRRDFQFPSSYYNDPEVRSQITWYVSHQQYLDRTISRAAPYMYYILQQTEQRNLPGELVLLPVLESAYNPAAANPSGAVGMWQLMRSTARGYGVKQDFWYDGRRDVYASTNAALDYLTYLQSYFGGDWLLAVAAYDSGEGTVQSAVHRNIMHGEDTAFWDLPLPAETRAYVPRLLALADIIRDPVRFGVVLPAIDDQPQLAQVDIGSPISLEKAAQLAGMSLKDIKHLNPSYSRMKMDPNGPYSLILPIDRVQQFKEALAESPKVAESEQAQYASNTDNTNASQSNSSASENSEQSGTASTKTLHTVKHGETLSSIAHHNHITISQLQHWNHLKGNAKLKPGMKLVVGEAAVSESTATQTEEAQTSSVQNTTTASANSASSSSSSHNSAPQHASNAHPVSKTHSSHSGHSTHLATKKTSSHTLSSAAKHKGIKTADLKKSKHLSHASNSHQS